MDDFEAILDRCYDQLQRGASLESALAAYPAYRRELEPLLRVAARLGEGPHPAPSARFRAGAVERFLQSSLRAPAPPVTSPAEPRSHGWLTNLWNGRLAMGTIISMVLALLLVGGGGAAYASAGALPGELLYQVRLSVEGLRLAAAPDQVARGELHLSFAEERLQEAMRSQADPQRLGSALAGYGEQLERGVALLGPLAGSDSGLATAMQTRLMNQERLLSQLPGEQGSQLQARLRSMLQVQSQVRVQDGEEPQEALGAPQQDQAQQRTQDQLQDPDQDRLQERDQDQLRLQTHQGITGTETISEPVRAQQRVQTRSEISVTETVTAPVQTQEQVQLRAQEQDQEQDQQQAQEQDQQQAQDHDQDGGSKDQGASGGGQH